MTTRWRKRLDDMRQLLKQAEDTYFDPNLFRLNINNAIQTSRTVTFLIQKEKNNIPDFDNWYENNVRSVLAADRILNWLKDARNIIEKQGDLDVYSTWRAYHLYSYTHLGSELLASNRNLLFSRISELKKEAEKYIPPGVLADSALVIDRKWVANSLPDCELIDAVSHGYKALAKIVENLDSLVGASSPPPQSVGNLLFSSQTRRAFLKFRDGQLHFITDASMGKHLADVKIDKLTDLQIATFRKLYADSITLRERVETLGSVAVELFKRDSNHIQICFLFGANKTELKLIQPTFDSFVDKLIFWHELGYLMQFLNVHTLLFISEAWKRDGTNFGNVPMQMLPIVGECLQVVGTNRSGEVVKLSYSIAREGSQVTIVEPPEEEADETVNFLSPIHRAWGLPHSE